MFTYRLFESTIICINISSPSHIPPYILPLHPPIIYIIPTPSHSTPHPHLFPTPSLLHSYTSNLHRYRYILPPSYILFLDSTTLSHPYSTLPTPYIQTQAKDVPTNQIPRIEWPIDTLPWSKQISTITLILSIQR